MPKAITAKTKSILSILDLQRQALEGIKDHTITAESNGAIINDVKDHHHHKRTGHGGRGSSHRLSNSNTVRSFLYHVHIEVSDAASVIGMRQMDGVIVSVKPDSFAAYKGIETGDRIVSVNGDLLCCRSHKHYHEHRDSHHQHRESSSGGGDHDSAHESEHRLTQHQNHHHQNWNEEDILEEEEEHRVAEKVFPDPSIRKQHRDDLLAPALLKKRPLTLGLVKPRYRDLYQQFSFNEMCCGMILIDEVVFEIVLNSWADKNGIRPGDEIIDINGIFFHQLTDHELHEAFCNNMNRPLMITMKRPHTTKVKKNKVFHGRQNRAFYWMKRHNKFNGEKEIISWEQRITEQCRETCMKSVECIQMCKYKDLKKQLLAKTVNRNKDEKIERLGILVEPEKQDIEKMKQEEQKLFLNHRNEQNEDIQKNKKAIEEGSNSSSSNGGGVTVTGGLADTLEDLQLLDDLYNSGYVDLENSESQQQQQQQLLRDRDHHHHHASNFAHGDGAPNSSSRDGGHSSGKRNSPHGRPSPHGAGHGGGHHKDGKHMEILSLSNMKAMRRESMISNVSNGDSSNSKFTLESDLGLKTSWKLNLPASDEQEKRNNPYSSIDEFSWLTRSNTSSSALASIDSSNNSGSESVSNSSKSSTLNNRVDNINNNLDNLNNIRFFHRSPQFQADIINHREINLNRDKEMSLIARNQSQTNTTCRSQILATTCSKQSESAQTYRSSKDSLSNSMNNRCSSFNDTNNNNSLLNPDNQEFIDNLNFDNWNSSSMSQYHTGTLIAQPLIPIEDIDSNFNTNLNTSFQSNQNITGNDHHHTNNENDEPYPMLRASSPSGKIQSDLAMTFYDTPRETVQCTFRSGVSTDFDDDHDGNNDDSVFDPDNQIQAVLCNLGSNSNAGRNNYNVMGYPKTRSSKLNQNLNWPNNTTFGEREPNINMNKIQNQIPRTSRHIKSPKSQILTMTNYNLSHASDVEFDYDATLDSDQNQQQVMHYNAFNNAFKPIKANSNLKKTYQYNINATNRDHISDSEEAVFDSFFPEESQHQQSQPDFIIGDFALNFGVVDTDTALTQRLAALSNITSQTAFVMSETETEKLNKNLDLNHNGINDNNYDQLNLNVFEGLKSVFDLASEVLSPKNLIINTVTNASLNESDPDNNNDRGNFQNCHQCSESITRLNRLRSDKSMTTDTVSDSNNSNGIGNDLIKIEILNRGEYNENDARNHIITETRLSRIEEMEG